MTTSTQPRTINVIQPIKDADNIEVLIVDGWKVVKINGEYHLSESIFSK